MVGSPIPSQGDLQTLNASLNQILIAIGALNKSLVASTAAIFPQINGTSTSATAGTHGAVPAQVEGYITITLPGGAAAKVPYFLP